MHSYFEISHKDIFMHRNMNSYCLLSLMTEYHLWQLYCWQSLLTAMKGYDTEFCKFASKVEHLQVNQLHIYQIFFSCPDRVCEQLNGPLLILKSISIVDPGHLWPLRHLIRVMRKHDLTNKKTTTKTKTKKMTMTNAFKAIFETCDLSNICRVMRKRQRQKQRH